MSPLELLCETCVFPFHICFDVKSGNFRSQKEGPFDIRAEDEKKKMWKMIG